MATLVLQAAGTVIGGLFGPVGAMIGRAAGAMGGYMLDNTLISSTRRVEGPRLTSVRPMMAEEGAALPSIYGTMRVSGTLIWATRFQEKKTSTRQGAKGGPKVTSYSYFVNAAFAIAAGEISGIRRIWADGKQIDQTKLNMRVYTGTGDQLPDPLIEAKQGGGLAPAYRDTAYVVFEGLPVEEYGNRLPLFQFEVIRNVGALAKNMRAVALIPGATEYGLSPSLITDKRLAGETRALNRNNLRADSDWSASLDELQSLCPQLQRVAIILPWFGNDLRAGHCEIRPGVTTRGAGQTNQPWRVNNIARDNAHLVSQSGDGAAYGGTPSDQTVIAAIKDAKRRGLQVTLYPFVMMDIASNNNLPSPDGAVTQPAYPWRGRITCSPAIGAENSADQTEESRRQVDSLINRTWGYRRFIRHYLDLARSAGGVDAFLIGSELCGLTKIRDQSGGFPFVEGLCDLAALARTILGAGCKITYAADWSEYFGYHPQDGSGDVYFHLDPLWSHPAIDAIGIDNYMPLSDWRDGDERSNDTDRAASAYDQQSLMDNIAGGEGYDWYYASEADRRSRIRTPIEDGLANKPWVFRYKDLHNWWRNPHFNRVGGRELSEPTAWQPMSKPFWFTELGCAAVDKGPNQPNVFPDVKSSENAVPYFSDGSRCDLASDRFLRAHLEYWQDGQSHNPISPAYGAPMLDLDHIYMWSWDTRPFPEFPLYAGVWGDANNWGAGHWLNGRLSGVALDELITAICADFGAEYLADSRGTEGYLSGYIIDGPASARSVLEPLSEMFGLIALELPTVSPAIADTENFVPRIEFRSLSRRTEVTIVEDYIWHDGQSSLTINLDDSAGLPTSVELYFNDPLRAYQAGSAVAERLSVHAQGHSSLSLSGAIEAGQAMTLAEAWLEKSWAERRSVSITLPWAYASLSVGDRIRIASAQRDYSIVSIEDGVARQINAVALAPTFRRPDRGRLPVLPQPDGGHADGPPLFHLLDLPLWPGAEDVQNQFRIACYAKPWRGVAVHASPQESDYALRMMVEAAATVGELVTELPGVASVSGRILHNQSFDVELYQGELRSQSLAQILNGANTALVQVSSDDASGKWEIIQFINAQETAANIWRLTGLLRGQAGTENQALKTKPAKTPFILLDENVMPAGLLLTDIGLELNWRVGVAGRDFTDDYFETRRVTGGLQALRPLSPVHIRQRQQSNGDVEIDWIRRGRIGADNWTGADIPLGEEYEKYLLELSDGDNLIRSIEVENPSWIYSADLFHSDREIAGASLNIRIAQLSQAGGVGEFSTRFII